MDDVTWLWSHNISSNYATLYIWPDSAKLSSMLDGLYFNVFSVKLSFYIYKDFYWKYFRLSYLFKSKWSNCIKNKVFEMKPGFVFWRYKVYQVCASKIQLEYNNCKNIELKYTPKCFLTTYSQGMFGVSGNI